MIAELVLVLTEEADAPPGDGAEGQEADDAHAGRDQEVDRLALVAVVGGQGYFPTETHLSVDAKEEESRVLSFEAPALVRAEHDLGASRARQRSLHGLEAVDAVGPSVLGKDPKRRITALQKAFDNKFS